MTGDEVRKKYIEFFKFGDRKHKEIKPAPLVLKDDPTTLFTSAGMQPLVPNLLGEKHPDGDKLVDSQPCFRSQDIEEVGDNRHDTLFEMLGNWGLGSYFKKEQIPWVWEFLIKELNLDKEKLYITIFEGNGQIPKDTESYDIWKSLGVAENHIYFYGDKKNWWSRAGAPVDMPLGEPGGPSSEVFFEFAGVEHDRKYGEKCHPNCDCGRFVEIANSVFVQYRKEKDGTLSELKQKNVDFGGGLERILMAVNNQPDMFKNDLHYPIIEKASELLNVTYEKDGQTKRNLQIIADHIKAAIFLIADGVTPSNKLQGYVLRRLLRRSATKAFGIDRDFGNSKHFHELVKTVIGIYQKVYFDDADAIKIEEVIVGEILKFRKTLESGLRKIEKAGEVDEEFAFDLFQSEGFPFEITQELLGKRGVSLDKNKFDELMQKHQSASRASGEGMFKRK